MPYFKNQIDLCSFSKTVDFNCVIYSTKLATGFDVERLEQGCIERGVTKFNVNTEVRKAYMDSLNTPSKDLVNVMASAKEAMKAVVAEKMCLFGSSGKAW